MIKIYLYLELPIFVINMSDRIKVLLYIDTYTCILDVYFSIISNIIKNIYLIENKQISLIVGINWYGYLTMFKYIFFCSIKPHHIFEVFFYLDVNLYFLFKMCHLLNCETFFRHTAQRTMQNNDKTLI